MSVDESGKRGPETTLTEENTSSASSSREEYVSLENVIETVGNQPTTFERKAELINVSVGKSEPRVS